MPRFINAHHRKPGPASACLDTGHKLANLESFLTILGDMPHSQRTEKDFWIEMSIREIWTQAHFAERAYDNLLPKTEVNTDIVFSSIHSFLSHCALVSKLLKSSGESAQIGAILGIDDDSVVHNRTFRNHLEHYDERLKEWIRKKGLSANIGAYNIGPKSAIAVPNLVYVSHYDPSSNIFTFVDEDLDLAQLHAEIQRIKQIADQWVQEV